MTYEDALNDLAEAEEEAQEQLASCECAGDVKDPSLYCLECIKALEVLDESGSVAEYMVGEMYL